MGSERSYVALPTWNHRAFTLHLNGRDAVRITSRQLVEDEVFSESAAAMEHR
jgi:hypothetical protein